MAITTAYSIGCDVSEGDESETVCDVFVIEDGGVFCNFHEVNGEGGDLGDHDAAEGIGDGGVGFGEDEFYFMLLDGEYFYFGESLVRHVECLVMCTIFMCTIWYYVEIFVKDVEKIVLM